MKDDHGKYIGMIIGFGLGTFISPLVIPITLKVAFHNSFMLILGVLTCWFAFEVLPVLGEKWDAWQERRKIKQAKKEEANNI